MVLYVDWQENLQIIYDSKFQLVRSETCNVQHYSSCTNEIYLFILKETVALLNDVRQSAFTEFLSFFHWQSPWLQFLTIEGGKFQDFTWFTSCTVHYTNTAVDNLQNVSICY